jgi:hypothetical protein
LFIGRLNVEGYSVRELAIECCGKQREVVGRWGRQIYMRHAMTILLSENCARADVAQPHNNNDPMISRRMDDLLFPSSAD